MATNQGGPMTPHADLVARLELALNEALLGRGIKTANVQRNYRLSFADADRLMKLREACFDALGALAALPPPADEIPQPPYCVRHGVMQANDEMGRSWSCGCQTAEPYDGDGYIYTPADPPDLVALVREEMEDAAKSSRDDAATWRETATSIGGYTQTRLLQEANEADEHAVQLEAWVERLALAYPLPAAPPVTDTPQGWQPIETAPKDGTNVLLGWFELPGMNMRRVGYWHPRENAWIDTHRVLHNQHSFPTHWHPLPAVPLPEDQ